MDDLETTQPTAPRENPAPEVDELDNELPAGDAVLPTAPVAPVATVPVAPTAPVAQTPKPTAFDPRTEIPGLVEVNHLTPEGVALETKRKLSLEPRVTMMIPLDTGEKSPAYRSVIINGYPFHIKKNTMVELPISVANLLKESYRIVDETLNNSPLNLEKASEEKRRALGIS